MEAVAVYSPHPASARITKAFAAGAKWPWIPVSQYREGPIAIYGLARGLLKVLRSAQHAQQDWIFLDHGYLHPGHFDGYYSVTCNAFQHTGKGVYDAERLDIIRPDMYPMRYGEHILLLPPSRALTEFIEVDTDEWIKTNSDLPTDRPIRVREKGAKTPLEEDFLNCHAVVTYNSKAAIKAAIAGISVFATDPCCITRISQPLLSIDSPNLHIDREGWLRALSYNQFTLDEMQDGLIWDLVTKS